MYLLLPIGPEVTPRERATPKRVCKNVNVLRFQFRLNPTVRESARLARRGQQAHNLRSNFGRSVTLLGVITATAARPAGREDNRLVCPSVGRSETKTGIKFPRPPWDVSGGP